MKRLILLSSSALLLVSCLGSSNGQLSWFSTTRTYSLAFDTEDQGLRQQLIWQSMDVINRRLESLGEKTEDTQVKPGDETQITIKVSDAEIADALTAQLTDPFTLVVGAESAAEGADYTIEGHGSFTKTDVTGDDIEWVQARQEPGTTTGEVRLIFTQEGRTKMAALFKTMKGKSIGIFVRDRLISKLNVETDELKDDIVISGIPDAELADIFADDVNVGLHVTFTPVP